MKKSDAKKRLQELAEILHADRGRSASERRYPQQALPALHDERVSAVLAGKLTEGEDVNAVVAFGHNPFTRLNHTLFVLGPDGMSDSPIGVLVITDFNSRVVGVIEDFELPQPGTTLRLPIARPPGTQPFVLQQPSMSEQMLHVGRPLGGELRQAGAREPGFAGYTPVPDDGGTPLPWPGGGGPVPWPPGGGGIPGVGGGRIPGRGGVMGNTTECSWTTTHSTLVGYSCKRVTGLLVPSCDAWGNDYVTDSQTDTEVDDSGADSLFGTGLNFAW